MSSFYVVNWHESGSIQSSTVITFNAFYISVLLNTRMKLQGHKPLLSYGVVLVLGDLSI